MSEDADYRRELELELERLTRELADVRVEKAQQRHRIEKLQSEQTQLQEQLGMQTVGDKELKSDLSQKLHSLHQVVRDKKSEHSKIIQEWERSKQQYESLKQSLGVLQGNAVTSLMLDNPFSQGDDTADESRAVRMEDASLCDTVDNDTVVTEHTKDSLQIHRSNQQRQRRKEEVENGEGGGLSKFFSKQHKTGAAE
jgi:hypothetical protein